MDNVSYFVLSIWVLCLMSLITYLVKELYQKYHEDDPAYKDSSCECIEGGTASMHTSIMLSICCTVFLFIPVAYFMKNATVGVGARVAAYVFIGMLAMILGGMAGFVFFGKPGTTHVTGIDICEEDVTCLTKETHGWSWALWMSLCITIISLGVIAYISMVEGDAAGGRVRRFMNKLSSGSSGSSGSADYSGDYTGL